MIVEMGLRLIVQMGCAVSEAVDRLAEIKNQKYRRLDLLDYSASRISEANSSLVFQATVGGKSK